MKDANPSAHDLDFLDEKQPILKVSEVCEIMSQEDRGMPVFVLQ